MPVCDGCGERVGDDHIRQRIERLELATRFRPIHINVLFVDAAPAGRRADFFYEGSGRLASRSPAVWSYFAELAKLVGATIGPDTLWEPILAEFQHRGFFLASAVECPTEDQGRLEVAIRRLAPTLVRRVQSSYRPKYVALISSPTRELIEPLRAAAWGDRLILDGEVPFDEATMSSVTGQSPETGFSHTSFSWGDRLLAAISQKS